MKLIIMGAGYVGVPLLQRLQGQNFQIAITTTQQQRVEELYFYGEEVFLLEPFSEQLFKELIDKYDGMIIMIAPRQGKSYVETYLQSAERVAKALEGRTRPFYLLYTSSSGVCEGVQSEWVAENTPLNPTSERGKILHETEECFLSCDVEVCILRLGGIYGPGRELTARAARLSGTMMAGSGEEATNNIHLEAIIEAIVFCLESSLTGVYHLVNDFHPTRKELYRSLCKEAAIPAPLWDGESIDNCRGGYKLSNSKIKEAGFCHERLTSPLIAPIADKVH